MATAASLLHSLLWFWMGSRGSARLPPWMGPDKMVPAGSGEVGRATPPLPV